jgi:hypothetical protein
MSETPQYWYAAKRYGWGWGQPITWQGWVVLVLLIVAAVVPAPLLVRSHGPGPYLAYVAVLAAVQLLVCYLKGPPPRWRWGDSDE